MSYCGTVTHLLFIMVFFTVPESGFAQSDSLTDRAGEQYELAWSGSDGLRHELYTSSFTGETWTDPVQITNNNANNLHPVIDMGADGTKWIFWSAVRPDGISIEYAIFRDSTWSEVQKMNFEQDSSITPSILIDTDNVVWLVWAGNSGNLDEIYFSRYRNDAWEKEKIINQANSVPDIKPIIALNDQGEIEVRWQGFREGQYKSLFSVHTAKGWSVEKELPREEQEKEEAKIQENEKIQLPAFMREESQYFLKVIKTARGLGQ